MAFGAQFTSVILIILTFLIGVYLRPNQIAPEVKKVEVVQEKMESPFGKRQYADLFLNNQAVLNTEIAEAIKTLLLNHDIFANISLYGEDQSLLLARSVVLQRFLADPKLPVSARKVYTYHNNKTYQAEVTFSFAEESEGLI